MKIMKYQHLLPLSKLRIDCKKILPIEMKTKTELFIPQVPPLLPSLDLAIKLQTQSFKEIVSSDQKTLWTNVRFIVFSFLFLFFYQNLS